MPATCVAGAPVDGTGQRPSFTNSRFGYLPGTALGRVGGLGPENVGLVGDPVGLAVGGEPGGFLLPTRAESITAKRAALRASRKWDIGRECAQCDIIRAESQHRRS